MIEISTVREPGTVLVFGGEYPKSRIISAWTCSPYTHLAVVATVSRERLGRERPRRRWKLCDKLLDEWQPRPMVFESTKQIDLPCEITGRQIDGVQAHGVRTRLAGYSGRVWAMSPSVPLLHEESQLLSDVLLDHLGAPYDEGGAILAGTTIMKRLLLAMRAADRSTLYCVEYVLFCLLYAMHGREFPQCEPGSMSPASGVRYLTESGLYQRPRRVRCSDES